MPQYVLGALLQTITNEWFRIKNLSSKNLNHWGGGGEPRANPQFKEYSFYSN